MAERYGSQCGYCTPGFVMSMFEAYHRADLASRPEARRPALRQPLPLHRLPAHPRRHGRRARSPAPAPTASASCRLAAPPALTAASPRAGRRALRPARRPSTSCWPLMRGGPDARARRGAPRWASSSTRSSSASPPDLDRGVPELRGVVHSEGGWSIGARPRSRTSRLKLGRRAQCRWHQDARGTSRRGRSATARRSAATSCNASPIGDLAPVLLALRRHRRAGAPCAGRRRSLLERLLPLLPQDRPAPGRGAGRGGDPKATRCPAAARADSFKVSKRREMDISIVAGAFVVDLDARRPSSPTPPRLRRSGGDARAGEGHRGRLLGQPWTEPRYSRALTALADDFHAHHRRPRRRVVPRQPSPNLFEKFVSERPRLRSRQDLPPRLCHQPRGVAPDDPPARCATRAPSATSPAPPATSTTTPSAGHAHALAVCLAARPRPHPAPRRHQAPRLPRRGRGALRGGHPRRQRRRRRRHDEPLLAIDEVHYHGHMVAVVVAEPRPSSRARRRRAWWSTTSRCPRCSGSTRPSRRTASTPRAPPHRAAAIPRRPRAARPPARRRAHHRRPGALLPGDPRRPRRARRRRRRRAALLDAAPDRGPGRGRHVLGLPRHKVVVESPRMGGGFGGKETQGNPWAAGGARPLKTGHRPPVRVSSSATSTCAHRQAPPLLRAGRSASTTTGAMLAAARCASSPTAAGPRPVRADPRPRALPPRQRYFIPALRLLRPRGKTNRRLAHRLPRLRRAAGHARHRGHHRRSPSAPSASPPHVVRERNFYGAGEATPPTTGS
jgi:hypothetical protein